MSPSEQAEQLYLARNSARAAISYAAGLASAQGDPVGFSQAVCLFISALEARTVRRMVGIEEQALDLVCTLREDRLRPRFPGKESWFLPPVAREPVPPRGGTGGRRSEPDLSGLPSKCPECII
ncbi:hypothetical protein [Deinococcus apachensis]|uniref:hypothetical protein n=1 Tax=Deinococcus apachensis TaxID=309886 RepID=UPI00036A361F|nr:hypothetical protein [Deinococcus apachensis]